MIFFFFSGGEHNEMKFQPEIKQKTFHDNGTQEKKYQTQKSWGRATPIQWQHQSVCLPGDGNGIFH
jgi:hypothetical protein